MLASQWNYGTLVTRSSFPLYLKSRIIASTLTSRVTSGSFLAPPLFFPIFGMVYFHLTNGSNWYILYNSAVLFKVNENGCVFFGRLQLSSSYQLEVIAFWRLKGNLMKNDEPQGWAARIFLKSSQNITTCFGGLVRVERDPSPLPVPHMIGKR